MRPAASPRCCIAHSKQDEFVYILEGHPTLVTDAGEVQLSPGMCAGFPAAGIAHQLVNRTGEDVVYLEIGDRTPGDEGSYPVDDLQAVLGPDGQWVFTHKDGRPLLSDPCRAARLRPNAAAQGLMTSIRTVMLRSSVALPGRIGTGTVGGGAAAAKVFIQADAMSARRGVGLRVDDGEALAGLAARRLDQRPRLLHPALHGLGAELPLFLVFLRDGEFGRRQQRPALGDGREQLGARSRSLIVTLRSTCPVKPAGTRRSRVSLPVFSRWIS